MTPTIASEDMNYWRLAPDARLRPWILCYWMVEPTGRHAAASETSSAESHQLLMPDGHSELVFHLAGSFNRWRIDEPQRTKRMRESYLIGGRTHSVLTRNADPVRLAGVKLDPRALRVLIRTSLAEFRDDTISFADLGCQALLDLEDAVANVRSPDALTKLFDRFFLSRLADVDEEPGIQSFLQRVRASRGSMSILQWASDQRIDSRTLERRFVARMGMTPKQYSRIVRFKHSYRRLTTGRPDAEKAHLDAYYDESHFSREFKHFVGTTPMNWFNDNADYRSTIGDHLLEGELAQTR